MSAAAGVERVPAGVRARVRRRRRAGATLGVAAVLAGAALGLTGRALDHAATVALVRAQPLEHALRAAVADGDLERAMLVVRLGADVDHRFADGLRAIDVAAARCDAPAVLALQRAGAARASRGGVEDAPLRTALTRCDVDTVRALAATAAEPVASTELIEAARRRGDPAFVAALWEALR